jgi:hypothetical protein
MNKKKQKEDEEEKVNAKKRWNINCCYTLGNTGRGNVDKMDVAMNGTE